MKNWLLYLAVAWSTQLPAQMGNKEEVLYNADIISLSKDGLSKEIVKAKIQGSKTAFNLSGDSLVSLKKAGIGDDIILVMMAKGTTTVKHAAGNALGLLPGFYYKTGDQFTPLESEVVKAKSVKGVMGVVRGTFNGLIPFTIHGEAAGSSAKLRILDENPVYYFVCDSLLSLTDPRSPTDFLLVKMAVKEKNREVGFTKPILLPNAPKTDVNIRVKDEQNMLFSCKRVSMSVYEIRCREPLTPGEYCFMLARSSYYSGHSYSVYDFGYSKK